MKQTELQKTQIKIHGWTNRRYISERLQSTEFNKYYQGRYEKSFDSIFKILSDAKFMVDLSSFPMDGGGTQYTFLDAIYHNCAIILNRRWIENVDNKYRDFKEGYSCYAVSNEKELAEILNADIDTTKVVLNAKKLLKRHLPNIKKWKELNEDI